MRRKVNFRHFLEKRYKAFPRSVFFCIDSALHLIREVYANNPIMNRKVVRLVFILNNDKNIEKSLNSPIIIQNSSSFVIISLCPCYVIWYVNNIHLLKSMIVSRLSASFHLLFLLYGSYLPLRWFRVFGKKETNAY